VRKYWSISAGVRYPTTISIPIPTEPELYITIAIVIMSAMWLVVRG
jgi:hypothetical protein